MLAALRSVHQNVPLRRLAFAALLAVSPVAGAVYNANMEGTVQWIGVYSEADYIYLRLTNQPTSHPGCNPAYFVIHQDTPQNRRNQMLAMLLAAKQSGEAIGIGYDNMGDCVNGYIRVHRVG